MKETLCVGIDVGKASITAGFISASLLATHKRFERCPSATFPQSRAGFESLVTAIHTQAPEAACMVLVERTGHYHLALVQFLQEKGIAVYWVHVQKRPKGMVKSDKRDALGLGNALYSQQVLGVQVQETANQIRPLVAPSAVTLQLRGLVHRRYELVRDLTQRKNKLTAICDQMFPELSTIIGNVNNQTALAIRDRYPTAADVAAAVPVDLLACRVGYRPGNAAFALLQELAAKSIGLCDPDLQAGLIFEQRQLIKELRQLQEHLDVLDGEIVRLVQGSREGRILMSVPPIGPIQAAVLLAHIGSIANFESAAALKAYCGWAPEHEQTGTTMDNMKLMRGGNMQLRQMVYLIAMQAVARDTEWRVLYQRLVPLKCRYDARMKSYRGKNKVIGRVAGQIIRVLYRLLSQDAALLAGLQATDPLPDPVLYDRATHQTHRQLHDSPLS